MTGVVTTRRRERFSGANLHEQIAKRHRSYFVRGRFVYTKEKTLENDDQASAEKDESPKEPNIVPKEDAPIEDTEVVAA